MTLDEAIKHCTEIVDECMKEMEKVPECHHDIYAPYIRTKERATEYTHYVEWLEELKYYRETIPKYKDLISRQAVLDNLSELNAISFYEAQEDSKEAYYEIRQSIKNMTPVNPQPCEDSNANQHNSNALNALEGDAISRQAVLDMMQMRISGKELYKAVYELPPVNPQERTGHWVEENINEWSRKVFCSECGCTPPFEHVSNGDIYSASGYGVTNKTKFCPNCGARMESEGLCDSCINNGCIFQSGIVRNHCDFYKAESEK